MQIIPALPREPALEPWFYQCRYQAAGIDTHLVSRRPREVAASRLGASRGRIKKEVKVDLVIVGDPMRISYITIQLGFQIQQLRSLENTYKA